MVFSEYSLPQWGSPLFVVLVSTLVLLGLYSLNTLVTVPYPKGVPLLREPPGATRFSLKTRAAYYADCPSLFREAYQNVSIGFRSLYLCESLRVPLNPSHSMLPRAKP